MKSFIASCIILLAVLATTTQADTFGTGANQFTLDFVPISGDASSANGTNISPHSPGEIGYKAFTDPDYDYRMGVYEITNDQWNKFTASLGVPVTGDPSYAYDNSFRGYESGTTEVPTNAVSWYEAAQCVNWLNTSTGHQAAYKFTGTQGQSDYTFAMWDASDAWGGTNIYRHKDAFYFLPTEDEWVKAAYWNGTSIQDYATKPGDTLHQGDGISGTGWNYEDGGFATNPYGPWNVGSGSEELNGTYDMMGNVWEWTESPKIDYTDDAGSSRTKRGSCWEFPPFFMSVNVRFPSPVEGESSSWGFRVACIPEPGTITLLLYGLASMLCWRRRR